MDTTSNSPDVDPTTPVEDGSAETREVIGLGIFTSPRKLERPRAAGRRAGVSPPSKSPPISLGSPSIYETILAQASPLLRAATESRRDSETTVNDSEEDLTVIQNQPSAAPMPELALETQAEKATNDPSTEKQIPDEELRDRYGSLLAEKEKLLEEKMDLVQKMDDLEAHCERQRLELMTYAQKLSEAESYGRKREEEARYIEESNAKFYDAYVFDRNRDDEVNRRIADLKLRTTVSKEEVANAQRAEYEALGACEAKKVEVADLKKKLRELEVLSDNLQNRVQASQDECEGRRQEIEKCRVWLDKVRREQLRMYEDQLRLYDGRLMEILPRNQILQRLSAVAAEQYRSQDTFLDTASTDIPSALQSTVNPTQSATVRHLPPRDRVSADSALWNIQTPPPESSGDKRQSEGAVQPDDPRGDAVPSQVIADSAVSSPVLPSWVIEGNDGASPHHPSRMSLEIADLQKQINMTGLVLSRPLSDQRSSQLWLDSPSRPEPLRIQAVPGYGREGRSELHEPSSGEEDHGSEPLPETNAARDSLEYTDEQSARSLSAELEEAGWSEVPEDVSHTTIRNPPPPRPRSINPSTVVLGNIFEMATSPPQDSDIGSLRESSGERKTSVLGLQPSSVSAHQGPPRDIPLSPDSILAEEAAAFASTSDSLSCHDPNTVTNTMPSSASNVSLRIVRRRSSMSERLRVSARNLAPIKTKLQPQALESSTARLRRTPVPLSGTSEEETMSAASLSPPTERPLDAAATSSALEVPQTPGLRRRGPMSPMQSPPQPVQQPDNSIEKEPYVSSRSISPPSLRFSSSEDSGGPSNRVAGDTSPETITDYSDDDKWRKLPLSPEEDWTSSKSGSPSPGIFCFIAEITQTKWAGIRSHEVVISQGKQPAITSTPPSNPDVSGDPTSKEVERELVQETVTLISSLERALRESATTESVSKRTKELISKGLDALRQLEIPRRGIDDESRKKLKAMAAPIRTTVASLFDLIGTRGRRPAIDGPSGTEPTTHEPSGTKPTQHASFPTRQGKESIPPRFLSRSTSGTMDWIQLRRSPSFIPRFSPPPTSPRFGTGAGRRTLTGSYEDGRALHFFIFKFIVMAYVVLVLFVFVRGPGPALWERFNTRIGRPPPSMAGGSPQERRAVRSGVTFISHSDLPSPQPRPEVAISVDTAMSTVPFTSSLTSMENEKSKQIQEKSHSEQLPYISVPITVASTSGRVDMAGMTVEMDITSSGPRPALWLGSSPANAALESEAGSTFDSESESEARSKGPVPAEHWHCVPLPEKTAMWHCTPPPAYPFHSYAGPGHGDRWHSQHDTQAHTSSATVPDSAPEPAVSGLLQDMYSSISQRITPLLSFMKSNIPASNPRTETNATTASAAPEAGIHTDATAAAAPDHLSSDAALSKPPAAFSSSRPDLSEETHSHNVHTTSSSSISSKPRTEMSNSTLSSASKTDMDHASTSSSSMAQDQSRQEHQRYHQEETAPPNQTQPQPQPESQNRTQHQTHPEPLQDHDRHVHTKHHPNSQDATFAQTKHQNTKDTNSSHATPPNTNKETTFARRYQQQHHRHRSISYGVGPVYWGFVPCVQQRIDIVKAALYNWLTHPDDTYPGGRGYY